MYKVLVGKSSLAGSLSRSGDYFSRAVSDLESKLNDGAVDEVSSVTPYVTETELNLVAIVKVAGKSKKEGK